jgi:hypothetical protein
VREDGDAKGAKMKLELRGILLALPLLLGSGAVKVYAQASAIPSAQLPGTENAAAESERGRQLLDSMVAALGGPLWLNRQDMVLNGRIATFYKGQPHEGAPGFEQYTRFSPFAERIILVAHFGVFIATDHRDVAELYTPTAGYEITFKGSKPLPAKEVQDFTRRYQHSLETVVHEWLGQPGVVITYEGSDMVERRLADRISIMNAHDEAVVLALDENTHLPLSLSFQWHDPVYHDINTDVEEFEDYHLVQGIETPYTITLLHNGDMTGQRFMTKVAYNTTLAPDLFDPNRPLEKKAK